MGKGSMFGWKVDELALSASKVLNMISSPSGKAAITSTASFLSFASVVLPICTITSTVSGVLAQAKLLELGAEITSNLKKLTESSKVSNSLQYQAYFAQHVYDFTLARIRAAKKERKLKEKSSGSDYLFIFHPGTDWHPAFEILQEAAPLHHLVGWTHSLDLIGRYVSEIRQTIGPDATIHILLPSAHMYLTPEKFVIDPSLFPVKFEGELAYTTEPYVYLNMPELDSSHFHQIGGLPEKPTTKPLPLANESVKKLYSTSAAVPAGVVGGLGGACLGLVGLCVLVPFAGPVVIAASILAPGAVLGAATALGTGAGVEKLYDSRHRKE